MSSQAQFDVFLAHNSEDKAQVRAIAEELKLRGLKPWLDDEQIRPGSSFQQEIQQAIPLVKTAAIFIGIKGLGRWQVLELESLVQECVENNIYIIPVLLPGVNIIPENLRFLRRYRFVSFLQQVNDVEAFNLLEWGITGNRPATVVKVTPPSETPRQQIDDFSSEKGVDYSELRNGKKFKMTKTSSLLQDDVITLECMGSFYTGFQWLSYNIKNGSITLSSNINAQTKWKVHIIGNGIVSLENLGVNNSLKWLAITQDCDVILTFNTKDNDTYIYWEINILDDGTVALKNLQEIRYLSWLDGKTEDHSVGLAPNTEDRYTGTHWEIFKH